jgi:hypothetical protein
MNLLIDELEESICLWFYNPLFGLGRFFSFLIFYTVGRTPWTGDQPVGRPPPTHGTNTEQTHTDIHASSWIRTHNHSVRVSEYNSYPRPRGRKKYLRCSNPENMGSNPTRAMDGSLPLFVLCGQRPFSGSPSMEPYGPSTRFIISKLMLNWNRPRRPHKK